MEFNLLKVFYILGALLALAILIIAYPTVSAKSKKK